MTVIDQLLVNNRVFAAGFAGGKLPSARAARAAVVSCMDSRLNLWSILGLEEGQVHLIRNAGGVVTEDTIRSLTISQRLLGTREIMLIHHTDCGMLTFTDRNMERQIEQETGIKPPFALEAFTDLDQSVRGSIERIQASPFVPHKEQIRGFVYQVEDGRLREVC